MLAGTSEHTSPRKRPSQSGPSEAHQRSFDASDEAGPFGVLSSKRMSVTTSRSSSLDASLNEGDLWPTQTHRRLPTTSQPSSTGTTPHEALMSSTGSSTTPPPPPAHGPRRQRESSFNNVNGSVPAGLHHGGHPTLVRVPAVPPRTRASVGSISRDAPTPSADLLELSSSSRRESQEGRSSLMSSYQSNHSHEHLTNDPSSSYSSASMPPASENSRRESLNTPFPSATASSRDAHASGILSTGKYADDAAHLRARYVIPPALTYTASHQPSPVPPTINTPNSTPRAPLSPGTRKDVSAYTSTGRYGGEDADGIPPASAPRTRARRVTVQDTPHHPPSSSSSSESSRHVRFVAPTDAAETERPAQTAAREPIKGRPLPAGPTPQPPQAPAPSLITLVVQTSAEREPVTLAASIVKATRPGPLLTANSASPATVGANAGVSVNTTTGAGAGGPPTALYQPDAAPVRSAMRPSSYTPPASSPQLPIPKRTSFFAQMTSRGTIKKTMPRGRVSPTPTTRPGRRPSAGQTGDMQRHVNLALVSVLVLLFVWVTVSITG